jgi:probable rRNA maturation factor
MMKWTQEHIDYDALAARAAQAVGHAVPGGAGGQIAISMTDDEHMQKLNEAYRGKGQPTNVLSFPAPAIPHTPEVAPHLGDIALGFETVAGEAASSGKLFEHHVTHLLVHGVLHLLGYDHVEQAAAEEMEALEVQILDDLGISNPYMPDRMVDGAGYRSPVEKENG